MVSLYIKFCVQKVLQDYIDAKQAADQANLASSVVGVAAAGSASNAIASEIVRLMHVMGDFNYRGLLEQVRKGATNRAQLDSKLVNPWEVWAQHYNDRSVNHFSHVNENLPSAVAAISELSVLDPNTVARDRTVLELQELWRTFKSNHTLIMGRFTASGNLEEVSYLVHIFVELILNSVDGIGSPVILSILHWPTHASLRILVH